MKHILTISKHHIAKPRSLGKDLWPLLQCLGRLHSCDEGKRVYRAASGVYQVENQQQLERRLSAS